MSYSLIDIPKENYQRLCTDLAPLYIPLGAMSGTDASFLRGGVVVGVWAVANAAITLEESFNAGVSYTTVTEFTADTITAAGTFLFKLASTTTPISPIARLKILPGAGGSLYVSKVFRSFCSSDIMGISGSVVPAGAATEITLDALNQQITDFDRNTGAATAETLRTVLATRHEAAGTPISSRLSDGADFINAEALAVAQKTYGVIAKSLHTLSTVAGWDGVNLHRELLVDVAGALRVAAADLTTLTTAIDLTTTAVDLTTTAVNAVAVAVAAAAKPEYVRANTAVLHNFAATAIVATLYTTVIAAITNKAVRWQFANTTGSWLQLANGAAGTETIFCQIPPGGAAELDKMLIATTRISVTSDENVITGKLSVCSFV
jgi:hypothetical protein